MAAEAQQQLQRWQRTLQFAASDTDRAVRCVPLRIVSHNDADGSLELAFGLKGRPATYYVESRFVESSDLDLVDLVMALNDKLQEREYSVTQAVTEMCLKFARFFKKEVNSDASSAAAAAAPAGGAGGHRGDENGSDSDDASDGEADFNNDSYADLADITPKNVVRKPHGDGSRSANQRAMVHSEFEKLDFKALRMKHGINVKEDADDPMMWHVQMFNFPAESLMQRELQACQQSFGVGDVSLEMHFTSDFPIEAPHLRVVRPRIMAHSGDVSLGGNVNVPMLGKNRWIPGYSLTEILVASKASISACEIDTRISHDYPKFCDMKRRLSRTASKVRNAVVMEVRCYEPVYAGEPEIERGNTIVLPESCRVAFMRKSIQFPFNVRIASQFSKVSTVCAVPRFDGKHDYAVVPRWLMQNLGVDNGAEAVIMTVPKLELGTFAQFEPQTLDFATDLGGMDPCSLISQCLAPFFTLTVGDIIPLNIFGKVYHIRVTDAKPGETICIHPVEADTFVNLMIDVLPAVERAYGAGQ